MIGIHIPVQVEIVYLVYHGHGIVAVVILRIIQPTMAAFVANIAEQVQAARLRDGARIIQMCVMAWYTIVGRDKFVIQQRDNVLAKTLLAVELPPPQLIAEAMAKLVVPAIRVILALHARVEHAKYRLYGALLLQAHG